MRVGPARNGRVALKILKTCKSDVSRELLTGDNERTPGEWRAFVSLSLKAFLAFFLSVFLHFTLLFKFSVYKAKEVWKIIKLNIQIPPNKPIVKRYCTIIIPNILICARASNLVFICLIGPPF